MFKEESRTKRGDVRHFVEIPNICTHEMIASVVKSSPLNSRSKSSIKEKTDQAIAYNAIGALKKALKSIEISLNHGDELTNLIDTIRGQGYKLSDQSNFTVKNPPAQFLRGVGTSISSE